MSKLRRSASTRDAAALRSAAAAAAGSAKVYAVGTDNKIYKQDLAHMTPQTPWIAAARGRALAVAADENAVYHHSMRYDRGGPSSGYLLHMQSSNITTKTCWLGLLECSDASSR